jgi:hypothetical protein
MKLSYIKITLSLALVSLAMTSCLKDKPYDDQQIQSTRAEQGFKVIEMAISVTNAKNFVRLTYKKSNNDTTVDLVPIHLATPEVAAEDINVAVELKPDLVAAYNARTPGASYSVAPSSMYSIVNSTVTIPKGSNTGFLKLKFNPSAFAGSAWALGFAITSIDKAGYTISGNFASGVVAIRVQ